MDAFKRRFKLSEYLLLFAGVGMLVSLPWLDGPDNLMWIAAKVSYGFGVVLYILKK